MKGSMNMTYKRSRAIAALAIVVIVAVCVAACGSSSSTSSSSSSSSAAAASGGARNRAKLVACLKQHGVTLPSRPRSGGGYGPPPGSPNSSANGTTNSNGNGNGGGNGNGNGNGNGGGNGNGNGVGNSGFHNGFRNGAGPGGRFNNPKFQAAFKACGATAGFRGRGNFRPSSAAITKFASCVKQHGYTLPKANLTGKGPVYPASIERNAKFQAASRSCQSLLRPTGAGGRPGGGAPPGA
jgi:hypothetical protein